MNISNMKNIVVLQNLPSNIIEEAIVVLKANQKIKKHKFVKGKGSQEEAKNENKDKYIVKEAEMIVSNYIAEMENKESITETIIYKKYSKFKMLTYLLSIVCWIELVLLLC